MHRVVDKLVKNAKLKPKPPNLNQNATSIKTAKFFPKKYQA